MLARATTRTFRAAYAPFVQTTCGRSISTSKPYKPIAFAFDIDGVLKQGPVVLPEAIRAIRMLEGENQWKRKVPYIFITNSGGKDENVRAKDLSNDFQTPVSPKQVVQAHTVMQSLVQEFGDKPILMIGGPDHPVGYSRQVLEGYGFRQVYTAYDLQAYAAPSFPYGSLPSDQEEAVKRVDFSSVQFAAILVFHDSRQWGRDIQYAIDIMRADRGVFGTVLTNEELKSRPPIPIFFSHGDFLWGNNFPVARLGQGAFRVALEAVYKELTGNQGLHAMTFGKPELSTYEYANGLLQNMLSSAGIEDAMHVSPENVWMIGDNPFSDIAGTFLFLMVGANNFGWSSALVRTGVYRDIEGPPAHTPTLTMDNVEVAVRTIMEKAWS